jgi:adenylate cyclase
VDTFSPSQPQAVREALNRILVSSDFDATDRIRRFLSYVVEETLSGRRERIKAYNIATSVFGRDETFDPQIDSIVRIVAGRMRRSIERYYLTAGRNDPLQIRIPKGSYVPVFEAGAPASSSVPTPAAVATDHPGAAVFIEQFTQEGDRSTFPNFTEGLSRLIANELSRFPGVQVFGLPSPSADMPSAQRCGYVLKGGASTSGEEVCVDLMLVHAQSGRTIWADNFAQHAPSSDVFAFRNTVASSVARTLGEPLGVINSDRLRRRGRSAEERDWVLEFYRYWGTFDPTQVDSVGQGLEQVVAREPENAEALACLSLLYSNAGRIVDSTADASGVQRDRALSLAERAVALGPASSWSHYALGLAYWPLGDVRGSLDALETAHAMNPFDLTITADLGQDYAMLANWNRAGVLVTEAFFGSPVLPGALRVGPFLYAFAHFQFAEALREARKMPRALVFSSVAVAAAAIRLGDRGLSAAAIDDILDRNSTYGGEIEAELRRRNMDPDLIGVIVDALRDAGLPGLLSPDADNIPGENSNLRVKGRPAA